MNTETLARATFVLDKSTAQDLSYLSSRMCQSRSELVRELLRPAVSELAALMRAIPENPTAADVERFRINGLSLMADAYADGLTALEAGKHG